MRGLLSFKPRRVLATIAFVSTLLIVFARAEAQSPISLRYFYSVPAVEESLADEYGQAIVAELARLMTLRADPACLSTNNLSADALKQAAGDILTRYGRRVWPLAYPDVSEAAVEAEFAKMVGAEGVSAMRSFAGDPNVQRMVSLSLPLRRDGVVDEIATAFDFYLMLAKLSIGSGLSPSTTGDQDLIMLFENRGLAFDDAIKADLNEAWYLRYIELKIDLGLALGAAIEASGPAPARTHSAFNGVEADLRNACVRLTPAPPP